MLQAHEPAATIPATQRSRPQEASLETPTALVTLELPHLSVAALDETALATTALVVRSAVAATVAATFAVVVAVGAEVEIIEIAGELAAATGRFSVHPQGSLCLQTIKSVEKGHVATHRALTFIFLFFFWNGQIVAIGAKILHVISARWMRGGSNSLDR
jgi:hypothetical protein